MTLSRAQAEMTGIGSWLEKQYPDTNTGRRISVIPLQESLIGDVRPTLLALMGAGRWLPTVLRTCSMSEEAEGIRVKTLELQLLRARHRAEYWDSTKDSHENR